MSGVFHQGYFVRGISSGVFLGIFWEGFHGTATLNEEKILGTSLESLVQIRYDTGPNLQGDLDLGRTEKVDSKYVLKI